MRLALLYYDAIMGASPRASGLGREPPPAIRLAGLAVALVYATMIVWVYTTQPRTFSDLRGGVQSSLGVYRVDQAALARGIRLFHDGEFQDARAALALADPDRQDPVVQFYLAYTYYRQGWGRFYHNNALYARGLEAVERAIALAPDGQVVVDDERLQMHTSEELRAELEDGIRRDLSDLNPMRVLKERK